VTSKIEIIPIAGIPEVCEGDDLSVLIVNGLGISGTRISDGDVLIVAQKIVSKAEGRLVSLESVTPGQQAQQWALDYDKDPRVVEVVMRESKRIVRMKRGVLIAETEHGFVCANAGVDTSNVAEGTVALLPKDPDASARLIRSSLESALGVRIAVVVSDTFGRPWREGLVNVALGVSGMRSLIDYRGQTDSHGNALKVTVIAVADELASAAELMMKKSTGVPVVIVRGYDYHSAEGSGRELIRVPELDLFR
jgi:coenzyme F420-0:L-glutamate ligase/coenzyme F420-1:gamma-L-glutamate ligase